jgi:hypothetical protein
MPDFACKAVHNWEQFNQKSKAPALGRGYAACLEFRWPDQSGKKFLNLVGASSV